MDQQRDKDHPANAVTLPKVLLVDDEASILHSLRRLLRKKFEITTTVVPEDALRHLEEDDYAVLLSDQRMPAMEGTKLMAKAREVSPDTVRIILTGYADMKAATEAIFGNHRRGNLELLSHHTRRNSAQGFARR